MIKLIKKIFAHRHKWIDCGWNQWSIAIEQRCKCGQYRHHLWTDIKNGKPAWKEGMHPNE